MKEEQDSIVKQLIDLTTSEQVVKRVSLQGKIKKVIIKIIVEENDTQKQIAEYKIVLPETEREEKGMEEEN